MENASIKQKQEKSTGLLKDVCNSIDCETNPPMNLEDEPYALKAIAEKQRRTAMSEHPHIAPLVAYLAAIKAEHSEKDLPCFDPCDGGIHAKVLFLLEAPGPKAVGSAFISRNNPDPTARNMCGLLKEAQLARRDTALWNIVPWYVGTGSKIRAVNKDDINEASPYLSELISLLQELKVIVLVGKKSQSAKSQIAQLTSVPLMEMPHPSATVFNAYPHKITEMRDCLRQVAAIVNGE